MVKLTPMKLLTYGTNHDFGINTKHLVTASFGNSPAQKPGGGQAVHFNGDPNLHRLTHDKARLLTKAGELAVAHLPMADLRQQHGFDYNVIEEVFPQGARFRQDTGTFDVNNVVDFQQLLEQFDQLGTFTTQTSGDRTFAVCPGLIKDKKGGVQQGVISLDGGEVSDEEAEFLAMITAKFAFDYYNVEMAYTKAGIRLVDLHTNILPAAFDLVGKAIKRKANV